MGISLLAYGSRYVSRPISSMYPFCSSALIAAGAPGINAQISPCAHLHTGFRKKGIHLMLSWAFGRAVFFQHCGKHLGGVHPGIRLYCADGLFLYPSSPKLGGDHKAQGVHKYAVVALLYPVRKAYLLPGKYGVGLHRANDGFERNVSVVAFAYAQHKPLNGLIARAKGDQHPLAHGDIILRPVCKQPVNAAVGYVHYHLRKQIDLFAPCHIKKLGRSLHLSL